MLHTALTIASLILLPGAAPSQPTDYVRPIIGTDEHGHVYPGATLPFGMVQVSPDTRLETWDGCSGYHYSDPAILGFSHTHLSGTGCGDLGDIRFIPAVAPVELKDVPNYRLPFSHKDESARPGYYSVKLGDPKVQVELSATAHVGIHRYTFPVDAVGRLILDLDRGVVSKPAEGQIVVDSPTRIHGYRHSKGWAADKTFFFVAEFNRPITDTVIEADGKPAGAVEGKGKKVYARLAFAASAQPLVMKIGISATGVDGAAKNLATELPCWDFQAVVDYANQRWNGFLGRIDAQFADPALRETFYTSLYHTAMAPTLFNDADGSYRGLDHQVHPAEGFQNYCTFSLWDTFRAEHPLLTIIQPQRVDDFVASMLAHYRQFNQHNLPVWSLAGNETWCMIANHSIPVIAEAYAKGFRRYDVEAVYQAVRDTSMQDRNLLGEYRKRGYVPSAKKDQSVSRTLEYAYNDWCVAQLAAALGKHDDAKLFTQRAANYRNLFDRETGFMRGKTAEGKWREPFDPRELVWADYTEGTAWNYSWFVPHDVPGLIGLVGGDRPFVDKLDRMYNEDSKVLATIPDLTGLIGQYVHGNEPCHHVAYLYAYAGAPWKTQQRVRSIMATLYNNTPGGICGNDDCGQTSAWYVMSALGFYPVNPALGVYVLGSPLVDRAVIQLDPKYQKGKSFTIVARNNGPRNVYVQSATLNGQPITRTWFTHAELVAGGELVLEMGPQPNPAWGAAAGDRPPTQLGK